MGGDLVHDLQPSPGGVDILNFAISIGEAPTTSGLLRRTLSIFRSKSEPSDSAVHELRRLARIVDDSEDAIISKDLTGVVTSWNRAAERIFGYSAEEIVGAPILRLFPERLVPEETVILERLRRGERIEHYETVRVRKDGAEIDVALTLSPLRGAMGEVVGASKIVRDITEAKQLRARLEELQNELLHVSRLNDMGQIAAAFAHELNQPLVAIGLFIAGARQALQTERHEDAIKGCDQALGQADRMREVIRRLRSFIEKREVQRRREDIGIVIDEAAALALVGRRSDGVTLAIHVADDAQYALMDRVQIQQVLVNLVRNAAEAMAGGPLRRIEVMTRRISGGEIEVEVADTGPGLPDEVLSRLFQPFTTTKPNGMGVGLSLCRSIIESQGGEIRAGNGAVSGAWFRFTLPAG